MPATIRLDASDNVVTARLALAAGEDDASQPIPRGHKLASHPIAAGDTVRKYAQVIG